MHPHLCLPQAGPQAWGVDRPLLQALQNCCRCCCYWGECRYWRSCWQKRDGSNRGSWTRTPERTGHLGEQRLWPQTVRIAGLKVRSIHGPQLPCWSQNMINVSFGSALISQPSSSKHAQVAKQHFAAATSRHRMHQQKFTGLQCMDAHKGCLQAYRSRSAGGKVNKVLSIFYHDKNLFGVREN